MSESIRSYSSAFGSVRSGRRKYRRSHGTRNFFIFLILVLVVLFFWVTADSYDQSSFIPAGQAYNLIITDPLEKRINIADSKVWNLFPQDSKLAAVSGLLKNDFGFSESARKHLVAAPCHVSGNDMEDFSDILISTKMTRLGTLLEKLHLFTPGISTDTAGGLKLRKLDEYNLFYSVRGRVLIASTSREAIVRALSQDQSNAVTPDEFVRALAEAGPEDVRGNVRFSKDIPAGNLYKNLNFALRFDSHSVNLMCRGIPADAMRDKLQKLLDGSAPKKLAAPPEAMLTVSADFGKPAMLTWTALEDLFGSEFFSQEQWARWENPDANEANNGAKLPQMLTQLAAFSEGGFRLAWTGVDMNAMVPLPEVVGVFDTKQADIKDLLLEFEQNCRATNAGRLPTFWGTAVEPTIETCAENMLLSTTKHAADSVLAYCDENGALPSDGNLYIKMQPMPCVQTIVTLGSALAEIDALRGYTKDSFAAMAGEWLAKAARIEDIEVLFASEGEVISADITLRCSATSF